MTILEVRLLHKQETGNYPFSGDAYGYIYDQDDASKRELKAYIEWLENKVVELKNETP